MINYNNDYFEDIDSIKISIKNVELLTNKSILITGCTGLICSTVTDILLYLNKINQMNITIYLAARNYEKVLKRFYNYKEGKDFFFVPYNATSNDNNFNINVDYIIHGASNASPNVFLNEPVETMLTNFIGLNNLMKLAVENNSKRVLYISSSEVYGTKNNILPYIEEDYGYLDLLNMRASYPSSKRASETLCVAYSHEYNIDTVIVRPGHIYGPAITTTDNRATAEFTRNAKNHQNIVMKSKGTQLRSYCYSLDCASAIIAVLINGKNGNAYNISNCNSICTISDIAKMFAKLAEINIIYEDASTNEKASYNLMQNSSLNSSKLENLGWKALFDLEKGVKKTLDYFVI